VADTAGRLLRLLRLLPLLTARPNWRGDLLAARLGVTTRDIDRLRELGYPVHAIPGRRGGYALGPGGARLPPRLRRRVEALTVATVPLVPAAPSIEPNDLALVALTCQQSERLRFRYRNSPPSSATAAPCSPNAWVRPPIATQPRSQPMIDLEITDGVAFITLNAPATRNALNNELAGLVAAPPGLPIANPGCMRRRPPLPVSH
jgi:hypothetical protein